MLANIIFIFTTNDDNESSTKLNPINEHSDVETKLTLKVKVTSPPPTTAPPGEKTKCRTQNILLLRYSLMRKLSVYTLF